MSATPHDPGSVSHDERRARRAAVIALGGYAASKVLVFISSPLLSYLIAPDVRGLVELVNPVVIGIELVSDLGIGPAIIQSQLGSDRTFLGVAWTIQAVRGAILSLVVCALAWPYAELTGHPELAHILPIAGLAALGSGLLSTKIFTTSRELAIGRLTAVELGAQIVGFVVKMVWAYYSPTAWSLVGGGLAIIFTKLVLSHALLPGALDRPRWDPAIARELARFGRWVLASTLLTFLTGHADRWIFGALIPLGMLGLFGNAAVIAALPVEVVGQLASRVVFPLYARVLQSGGELAPVFQRARRPLLVIGGWAIAGLVAGAPTAMRLLWDEDWWGSGWMIQILVFASWFRLCETTNGAALLARGEPRWLAAGSLAKLIAMCVAIPIGYAMGGFLGALVAYASTEVVRYAVSVWAVSRIGLQGGLREDLAGTLMIAATGIGGWQIAELARAWGVPVIAEAALVAVVVTLAWAPLAMPAVISMLRERRARTAMAPARA